MCPFLEIIPSTNNLSRISTISLSRATLSLPVSLLAVRTFKRRQSSSRDLWLVLLGSFLTGRPDSLTSFFQAFSAQPLYDLFVLTRLVQLQKICIYLSRYDLLITFVGFESHVGHGQLHVIDVKVTKGGVKYKFVWFFGGVLCQPWVPTMDGWSLKISNNFASHRCSVWRLLLLLDWYLWVYHLTFATE